MLSPHMIKVFVVFVSWVCQSFMACFPTHNTVDGTIDFLCFLNDVINTCNVVGM